MSRRPSSLALFCPSTGGHEEAVVSWRDTMSKPWDVTVDDTTTGLDAGFLTKCEKFWPTTQADIIAYFHNDLFIHEHGWDERVMEEFRADEKLAIVGFVGATRLGHPDIYRTPYDYTQLARADVWSGLTDAEAHGRRTKEPMPVVVVDSCAVIVRREFLSRVGGWPVTKLPDTSHCSDLWLCGLAARYGQRVLVVPVGSTHRSGGKGEAGVRWLDQRGGDTSLHRLAHEVTYREFSDVLPLGVPCQTH